MTVKKINLEYPVVVEKENFASLSMRRPKVKDMKVAAKSSNSKEDEETTLIANLCDVDPAVVNELDLSDYAQLQEVLSGFLEKKSGKQR